MLLSLDLLTRVLVPLLAPNGTSACSPSQCADLGSGVEFAAAATAVVALLALVPLVVGRVRSGDQTSKDSGAAVRHFLPV